MPLTFSLAARKFLDNRFPSFECLYKPQSLLRISEKVISKLFDDIIVILPHRKYPYTHIR